jgi:hypothetical protein
LLGSLLFVSTISACEHQPPRAAPAAPPAAPTAEKASVNPEAPSDPALALPAVERARIEYALASAQLLAQDWPWMRADETCVLLLAPSVQWVINCQNPPPTSGAIDAPLLGRPVYANASTTALLGGQSVPVSALIQAVPAVADVGLPGVSPAAGGGDAPWLIVSSLDALIAHHPAFNAETSTEEWLSIVLHEFFHTRQLLAPSFGSTLAEMKAQTLEPGRLEKAFKEDSAYRALVEREYRLLSDAAARDAALTSDAARAVLAQWKELYDERKAHLLRSGGEPLQRADVVFTYVEGTARYAEAMFLGDPRFHAALPLTGDPHFNGFRGWSTSYAGLSQHTLIARYFYSIGLHLGLLLDRVDGTWKARVSEAPDWIIGIASEAAATGKRTSAR